MAFFAGLNAEKYDRQYSDRQLIGRIAEYFKPQVRRLAVVTLLVTMSLLPQGFWYCRAVSGRWSCCKVGDLPQLVYNRL